jgi:hypothetical protein
VQSNIQQLSLPDQFYRQSKIDEENRRLKKKSKSEGGSGKKGKKSSKKSDLAAIDDLDDDIYPTVKVTRGGELPEGTTESGNEDNEEYYVGKKNKKQDPHRALNIDFNEKPNQPPQPKESIPVPLPPPPAPVSTEKPKKLKKKKTTESSKTKHKRERSDYKELVSPADDEEKRETATPPPPPVVEEKPKKKKTKEKKPPTTTVETNTPAPLLLDIMNDDINPINQSTQQPDGQDAFKLAAQSDNLIIVRSTFQSFIYSYSFSGLFNHSIWNISYT